VSSQIDLKVRTVHPALSLRCWVSSQIDLKVRTVHPALSLMCYTSCPQLRTLIKGPKYVI
jgi:hypothetical protein